MARRLLRKTQSASTIAIASSTAFFALTILSCCTLPSAANATDYYVAMTGSDSNPGTQSLPFRTIQSADGAASAGSTIYVAPGSYAGDIITKSSGVSTSHIHFLSTTKWGATINSGSTNTAWSSKGNYVDIDGFEVDGRKVYNWLWGIYMTGNGTIENNKVHDIDDLGTCNSNGGAGVEADSWYEANAIINISGNLVYNIGTPTCNFVHGIYVTTKGGNVYNNIIYQVGSVAIQLWHDATHINIYNNTIFASGSGILVGSGDYVHTSGPDDYTNVFNNIIVDNGYNGIEEEGNTGTHNTYTNNMVFKNANANYSLHNGNIYLNTLATDPQFVFYLRNGGGDYTLWSDSPARNAGTSSDAGVSAPTTDFDGNPRPVGRAPDIGAYEFSTPR